MVIVIAACERHGFGAIRQTKSKRPRIERGRAIDVSGVQIDVGQSRRLVCGRTRCGVPYVLVNKKPSTPPPGCVYGVGAIRAPGGGVLRFIHQDIRHAASRPSANRPTRLAHVNLNATDVDGAAAFYARALGFRLTDRTKAMAFARCNDDHHAIVIAEPP